MDVHGNTETVMARTRPNSKTRLKKLYLSLYLDEWQADALRALSAKTDIPQQVYLRRGITLVLKKHGITKPKEGVK
jgi:hypothetical protein